MLRIERQHWKGWIRGSLEPAQAALLSAADQLMNLVCPPECVWCDARLPPGMLFCGDCRSKLVSDFARCPRCATPIPSVVGGQDCFRCRNSGWKFSRVITLGPYRGRRREAIILIKKRSFESLRMGLGGLLAELIQAELLRAESTSPLVQNTHAENSTNTQNCLPEENHAVGEQAVLAENGTRAGKTCIAASPKGGSPWIVPIPYHWSHAFSTAAPTANSLAWAIGRHTGFAVKIGLARRTRKTAKQGMLSWTERKQNVRGAFKIRGARDLSGRHVLLVDDVLTSGATAGELAQCFMQAGAGEVSVVVVARGTGSKESSAQAKNLLE